MLAQNDNKPGARRGGLRTRRFKVARIITEASGKGVTAVIRNSSRSGASLEIPGNLKMAQNFIMCIDSEDTVHHCQMRWRNNGTMGVEILA